MSRERCTVFGCPDSKIWGLVRPDGRVARFSFSRSVLRWVRDRALNAGRIARFSFQLGRSLEPGEESESGLYALVANRGSKGRALRVCYSADAAQGLLDEDSRSIREFWLTSPQGEFLQEVAA